MTFPIELKEEKLFLWYSFYNSKLRSLDIDIMLFNLYIYNRRGKCLYYQEWNRPLNTLSDDPEEEKKLMWAFEKKYLILILILYVRFGMLFSLKDLASKLSPTPSVDGVHVVKTNSFTLHHFQSATGIMFIINTSPDVTGLLPIIFSGSSIIIYCLLFQIYFRICNIYTLPFSWSTSSAMCCIGVLIAMRLLTRRCLQRNWKITYALYLSWNRHNDLFFIWLDFTHLDASDTWVIKLFIFTC